MKKLGKKLSNNKMTVQAYMCNCDACSNYCGGSIPSYAPQNAVTGDNRL